MEALLKVFLHTLGIYVFLIVALRLLGARQIGQLTVADLVIFILLGSAVETAMVNANTSLPAGIVSAGTLLVANRLLNEALARSKRLRHLVTGGSILLVHHGHVIEGALRRAGLTHEDVLAALREHGETDFADVKYAVREADGSISVVPADHKVLNSGDPVRELAPQAAPSS